MGSYMPPEGYMDEDDGGQDPYEDSSSSSDSSDSSDSEGEHAGDEAYYRCPRTEEEIRDFSLVAGLLMLNHYSGGPWVELEAKYPDLHLRRGYQNAANQWCIRRKVKESNPTAVEGGRKRRPKRR